MRRESIPEIFETGSVEPGDQLIVNYFDYMNKENKKPKIKKKQSTYLSQNKKYKIC